MAMSIVSGVTSVQIDGNQYSVTDASVKFEMATINREAVTGKNGVVFYKESPQPAKLSFSILVPSTVDVSTFNGLNSSHVVVQLANGATLNATSFATSGNNEYDANEGALALEWFGQSITVTLGS